MYQGKPWEDCGRCNSLFQGFVNLCRRKNIKDRSEFIWGWVHPRGSARGDEMSAHWIHFFSHHTKTLQYVKCCSLHLNSSRMVLFSHFSGFWNTSCRDTFLIVQKCAMQENMSKTKQLQQWKQKENQTPSKNSQELTNSPRWMLGIKYSSRERSLKW